MMNRTLVYIFLLFATYSAVNSDDVDIPLTTKKGPIIGIRVDPNPDTSRVPYDAFIGIPYGQISARFQLAESRSNWSEPLYTQKDGPWCPQVTTGNYSEDCLFINVYTPVNASSSPGTLPVIVLIHGAAFSKESSSSLLYTPDFLVNASVAFVSMNYRLGAPGFLTLGSKVAPGNLGLHDTVLALQWVQDEISVFGGDPSQVTLYGSSSGAIMVMMHYLSPLSTELFERVIATSGTAISNWGHSSMTDAVSRAKLLTDAVGCDSTQNDSTIISCLQQTDISYIIGNQTITLSDSYLASGRNLPWLPVLDTYLTAETPFFNDTFENLMAQAVPRAKPIITGINTDEGIIKFEDSAWSYIKDDFSSFIPENLSSTLSDEEKTTLGEKIKTRYFNSTLLNENKVRELIYLYRDSMFGFPLVQTMQYFANLTYGYLFAYDGSWAITPLYFAEYRMRGVNHADDLVYLFYDFAEEGIPDLADCASNDENLAMHRQFIGWWSNFSRTGVPDDSWQTVGEGGYYLVINNTLSTISREDFDNQFYTFWANLGQDISAATTLIIKTSSIVMLAYLGQLLSS